MGTNYYARSYPCECCGRTGEDLHLGKSSAGWDFMLHVYPEKGIRSLEDWVRYIGANDVTITDERDKEVSLETLLRRIIDREPAHKVNKVFSDPHVYLREADGKMYRSFMEGEAGCIGHGKGPWCLIEGDFS